ncbi:A/G-specific adenine glycosylase [Amnibacterium kyonggiense]|uniref:Adenine DNA glycosylase n=1 Tax=Amnibacterium kyonggiense TaxID=595671 RepID=A0A4R7FIZ7_9MICO|nr:A/G-specific adenine glycosylase [Amnibacterium kyonggiense]TDS75732.1 A/G-specific DNA-adenine glycosylase [Amnibacterium kyonggiense]
MTALDPALVVDWFAAHARDLPWRRPGFSAWGTLVSEFMLQQTQVARVVPILEDWLRRWPTPADLAAAPPSEVLRAWGRLGYPRRALALHACATTIAEQHGNVVPEDVDALLALPGIGDYTARAIAVFAHGHRHPVVDTNVRRVIARAVQGVAQPGPPNARRDLPAMAALLPEDLVAQRAFNAGTMELGAIVCTARAPRCGECPLADVCAWRLAGHPEPDGPPPRRQARFEGSDRQRRGRVMAELRASDVPVSEAELAQVLPDPEGRARILAGLERDGLAARSEGGWSLPL